MSVAGSRWATEWPLMREAMAGTDGFAAGKESWEMVKPLYARQVPPRRIMGLLVTALRSALADEPVAVRGQIAAELASMIETPVPGLNK